MSQKPAPRPRAVSNVPIPPPHDLDAEAAVLSAALTHPDETFPKILDVARPSDFFSESNRFIAEAAWALWAERSSVDVVTVATRLRNDDRLERAGGTPYLAQLTDATPAVAHVDDHARIVRDRARARRIAAGALAVAAEAKAGGDVDDLATRLRELAEDFPAKAAASPLESQWIDVADSLEFVNEQPPPQSWLLTQFHGMHDYGVLPRGRTGMVNATGGVGKTYAVAQLAVAVANGGFWLETFRVAEPGHVLLALAEEDADEARRRIWRAINAAELTPEQRREVASRLHLLPLHGVPVALTCSPSHGVVEPSDFARDLRAKLDGFGVDWSCIVLDPLSRWGGGGVEANNEVATRFVQVIETLTSVRGSPSVVVAHHSSQTSTRAGESDARGVTAIRDGFRWQVTLDAVDDDESNVQGVLLRNRKSNYSLRFRPLLLVRNAEPGVEGTLRPATDAEADALKALLPKERQSPDEREQVKQNRDRERSEKRCAVVLEILPVAPAHMSRDELAAALGRQGHSWSFDTIRTVVAGLIREGDVVDLSDGSRSRQRQWARKERDS